MKTNKIIFIAAIVLFFSGCYQVITQEEIEKAEKFCEKNDGLVFVGEYFFAVTEFKCKNGAKVSEIIFDKNQGEK